MKEKELNAEEINDDNRLLCENCKKEKTRSGDSDVNYYAICMCEKDTDIF